MHMLLYIRMGVGTLIVLFTCLESSMHMLLYICMGVGTLIVLYKCIESSMHKFLVHMHGG
jgi:hypothetical protein